MSSVDSVGRVLIAVSQLIGSSLIGIVTLTICTAIVLNALEEMFLRRLAQRHGVRRWLAQRAVRYTTAVAGHTRGFVDRLEKLIWPDRAVFALPSSQLCAQFDRAIEDRPVTVEEGPLLQAVGLGPERSLRGFDRVVDELQARLISQQLLRTHALALLIGFLLFYLFADFAFDRSDVSSNREVTDTMVFWIRFQGSMIFGFFIGVLAPPLATALSRYLRPS